MATYAYDDFRIVFTPRGDGTFDLRATTGAGTPAAGVFTVPLSEMELQRAVLSVARSRSRAARDVVAEARPPIDAQQLGGALAAALFAGDIGERYEEARQAAEREGRGLRLSLSLAGAPSLLSVPWEFLFRRPRFLASQRRTPLVRLLDTGEMADPPEIATTVRILGVVANPTDLSQLDVAGERRRVETALDEVIKLGRVELDWLDKATPGKLQEALRDGSYHVLHYIGHSDFTPEGEGLLFLEHEHEEGHGASFPVNSTVLANLLSDQDDLRLVVLNSCEGARTTLTDPYAGVATTLIQLGVPAVVAMQFEISDEAALVFAQELYTNVIGRQDAIDASVSEARKALLARQGDDEWATPVLFVRDPEIQLFDFRRPAAPLPPPSPPADPSGADTGRTAAITDGGGEAGAGAEALPADERPRRRMSRARKIGLGIAAGTVAVLGGLYAIGVSTELDGSTATTLAPRTDPARVSTLPPTSADPTVAPTVSVVATGDGRPRPRTGFLAAEVAEGDGERHILVVDPNLGFGQEVGEATDRAGAIDRSPTWDRATNRIAFHRIDTTDGVGAGIFYVIPGNGRGDRGKQVAPLVPFDGDEFAHEAAWAGEDALVFARTDGGCQPGPGCGESVVAVELTASDDGAGFSDVLTAGEEVTLGTGFDDVRDIAAAGDTAIVADSSGLWGLDADGPFLLDEIDARAVAFTGDGTALFTLVDADAGGLGATSVHVYDGTGPLGSVSVLQLVSSFVATGGDADGINPEAAVARSVSGGIGGDDVLVAIDAPGDGRQPLAATVSLGEEGPRITAVSTLPAIFARFGNVAALAF
ncbi:MAG: CHAT domain-containing protein [Acidimicrobiia bacterium]|nr:CHAT domain-containing protein [Acidimicrobiia bacterium]